jgi:superfamily I DNA and/or RNA helicase
LDVTKQIQVQNKDLVEKERKNLELMDELKETLKNIEDSKEQIENQNTELLSWKDENEKMSNNLRIALDEAEEAKAVAEKAKAAAENDLDLLQKKSQFELIGSIVKVSLIVILSVGVVTTGMYIIAMFTDKDTQIISSTWSNMFGILLTNAFSIIGTIMGVKYASEKPKE